MFYALVLILSINGQDNVFVMDHHLTKADCAEALHNNPDLVAAGKLWCQVETKKAR